MALHGSEKSLTANTNVKIEDKKRGLILTAGNLDDLFKIAEKTGFGVGVSRRGEFAERGLLSPQQIEETQPGTQLVPFFTDRPREGLLREPSPEVQAPQKIQELTPQEQYETDLKEADTFIDNVGRSVEMQTITEEKGIRLINRAKVQRGRLRSPAGIEKKEIAATKSLLEIERTRQLIAAGKKPKGKTKFEIENEQKIIKLLQQRAEHQKTINLNLIPLAVSAAKSNLKTINNELNVLGYKEKPSTLSEELKKQLEGYFK